MKTNGILLIFSLLAFISCAQRKAVMITGMVGMQTTKTPLQGVLVAVKGSAKTTFTNEAGYYRIAAHVGDKLVFKYLTFQFQEKTVLKDSVINVLLSPNYATVLKKKRLKAIYKKDNEGDPNAEEAIVAPEEAPPTIPSLCDIIPANAEPTNTEVYKSLGENIFHETHRNPLTTFSVDVDRAAYSNVRRMLNMGQLPPRDAVRIEEMINYFDYKYPQPTTSDPIGIYTEMSDSPWNKGLKILQIGLQAKTIAIDKLPPSNLVFLVDVSGSMSDDNKLPLVKQALIFLTDQLRPQDRIAIVVYAGAAGVVLNSTAGNQKLTIKKAIENLLAGGSTAGGAGIELAYKIAQQNFISAGNNRIILATDGDFNVGASSEGTLEQLIEKKREKGIFLSVLGFGMGNYKDNIMETLADKGNGNYAYIDTMQEAHKIFGKEFGGTLFAVAKDVKLQLEFNPKFVKAYRLIGYENRMLKNEDFHNDKKDAGEMGSGHSVTALYEIVPTGIESSYLAKIDDLKYQQTTPTINNSHEILTLKIRYKNPAKNKSQLMIHAVNQLDTHFEQTTDSYRFAVAVAEFGLLLRNSEYKGTASYDQAMTIAESALKKDTDSYRAECARLMSIASLLYK